MKILVCCPLALSKEVGTPKVFMELVDELKLLGWDCDLKGPTDLDPGLAQYSEISDEYRLRYAEVLRTYLHQHAHEYDVVDYDREFLPFSRSEFCPSTLFVARSALLLHHLELNPTPIGKTLRKRLGNLLKGRARQADLLRRITRSTITIQSADLVNVSTEDDKTELIRRGISATKIVAIPYGISRSRQPLFNAVPSLSPAQPIVSFVGTFDHRKGENEFPQIVRTIATAVPGVKFRLLGTMYKSEQVVLSHFDKHLHPNIEVIPYYKSEELPTLLSSCSIGIFPSYLEGFPFGVLEMLAASVPVIAYQAPGAPAMLSSEYLVPRGEASAMSQKVIHLLQHPEQLQSARIWAKQQSQQFSWEQAAQRTSEAYLKAIQHKRQVEYV